MPNSDSNGGPTPQAERTWQPFIGFIAEVPPLAARRYEIRYQSPLVTPANTLRINEDDAEITLENDWWRARFSREQAAIVELVDLHTGRNIIDAPIQLFAMHDVSHAWGGENRAIFNEPVSALDALSAESVGTFVGMEGRTGPALRVIAKGSVHVRRDYEYLRS